MFNADNYCPNNLNEIKNRQRLTLPVICENVFGYYKKADRKLLLCLPIIQELFSTH